MSIEIRMILIFTLALVLAQGCKQQDRISLEQVVQTIETAEAKLNWLEHRLALERWAVLTKGKSDSLDFFNALAGNYYANNDALDILNSGRRLIREDEVSLRKLDLLRTRLNRGRAESIIRIARLRDSLLRTSVVSPDAISAELTLKFDADRTRRELAFRASHDGTAEEAEALARLIRLRNQEARRHGYNDYYTMMFDADGYSLDEFISLLTSIEEATRSHFMSILGRLGRNGTDYWDVNYALSKPLAGFENFLPADSQWVLAALSFDELGFDIYDMPIYTSLRIDADQPLGIRPIVIAAPHDMRLRANLGPGLDQSRFLAGSIGQLIHSAQITKQEPLFSNIISPTWSAAITGIFSELVYDPDWLTRYRLFSQDSAMQIHKATNELALVALRQMVLDLTFEYEAYRSSNANLNQLYWNLAERILQLPRHDDLYPWADDTELIARPVTRHNQLLGQIIAAQTTEYLRHANGSVVNNPETRSFLVQNYLRFGSRYAWPEMLQRGTGEKLTFSYLTDQLQADW